MPPRKHAAAPVFDIAQYRDTARYYVWREIEREDQEPLRVKLQDLTVRQTNDLAFGTDATMGDIYAAIAPYVVAWNLRAENLETGVVVDVPPPAEIGSDVFELLPNTVTLEIYFWLKTPWLMRSAEKKEPDSTSSEPTEPQPSASASA